METNLVMVFMVLAGFSACKASQIGLGSRLLASTNKQAYWESDNGTFAFGFTPMDEPNKLQLAIWFAQLPGDHTIVWYANR